MNDAAEAGRPTVLVVDDTPQNLSLMSDLLEAEYNVKLAPGGVRALKIVAVAPPDLILLDIMMPEMDGYAVCRTLKADPATRDIPIIFLTAMDRMEDEEKGLRMGAMDYITKPISPSILLARVRNQLALKEGADRLRQQNRQLEEEKSRTRELLRRLKEAADKLIEHNRQLKHDRSAEVLLRLGGDYLGRGQLDTAWELLRECPLGDDTMEILYALGLAFDAHQQAEQAAAVFMHMAGHNPQFRDIGARLSAADARAGQASAAVPASAPMADMPRSLGRYQVHKVLGKGAMGVVYLGSDPIIGRVVAIKTLTLADEFAGESLAEAKERFFREAESAGSLAHPNIVTIYDVGEENGLAYIAMEFLKGDDLSARARPEGLLPLDKVLYIVERVAEALGYAHARGIVHRDIKPANIVYEPESDSVKVTDFGIASLASSSRGERGVLAGTPAYMSPEQVAGQAVDGRSDLYSLGVTLYALACGRLPFKADSLEDLLRRIAGEAPADVRSHNPQLPDCVAAIVHKALAKDPAGRFQGGADMVGALSLCRRSLSVFAT